MTSCFPSKTSDSTCAIQTGRWYYTAAELRGVDPVISLVEAICRQFDLDDHRPVVFLVISELITNALDHGVLGLRSEVKEHEDGFERYLQERSKRLARLRSGSIVVQVRVLPVSPGSPTPALQITVTDSGSGFNFRQQQYRKVGQESAVHGRGLMILRHLCDSVEHFGNGNSVQVEFRPAAG